MAAVAIAAAILIACGSDDDGDGGHGSERAVDTAATRVAAGAAEPSVPSPTTSPPTTSAPAPAESTTAPPPPGATAPPTTLLPAPPRVLLVGDSTLLAVGEYGALVALGGMDPVYEAASCRALGQPSCGDDPPTNSVTVIDSVEGAVDVVVIMAGYDEWYTTFADSFDQVVASARAKGAKRVVWLTYPEGVDYRLPDERQANESLVNMNQIMREKVASGAFPDVVIADWFAYSAPTQGWYSDDDIHLSRTGAFGVADYISRKIAFLGGQPCPAPREPGQAPEAPCPDPDVAGPVPDVVALYVPA